MTLDLSLGYNTGDVPANDYLKHLSIQLVVNNFMNKKPNFAYYVTAATVEAFEQRNDPAQRVVSLNITKVW